MSKICYFFATRDDLLGVSEDIESSRPLRYTRFDHVTKLPPESFASAADIPHLGIATHPSAGGGDTYLVCDREMTVKPRPLRTVTIADLERASDTEKKRLMPVLGVERFAIDQLFNPDTITFDAGGIWKGNILLNGSIGSASDSKISLELMKRFISTIKSKFKKVRAFYVGPQAMDLLKKGARLTISEDSPTNYDLKA